LQQFPDALGRLVCSEQKCEQLVEHSQANKKLLFVLSADFPKALHYFIAVH